MLVSSGVAAADVTHVREADMRYVGQGHEIRVPWPTARDAAGVRAAFEAEYERLYGRLGPEGVPLEAITWRVQSSGPPADGRTGRRGRGRRRAKGERQACIPELGGLAATPVYDRYRLAPGAPRRRARRSSRSASRRSSSAPAAAPSSTSAGTCVVTVA